MPHPLLYFVRKETRFAHMYYEMSRRWLARKYKTREFDKIEIADSELESMDFLWAVWQNLYHEDLDRALDESKGVVEEGSPLYLHAINRASMEIAKSTMITMTMSITAHEAHNAIIALETGIHMLPASEQPLLQEFINAMHDMVGTAMQQAKKSKHRIIGDEMIESHDFRGRVVSCTRTGATTSSSLAR
jgi:hypothetical protein